MLASTASPIMAAQAQVGIMIGLFQVYLGTLTFDHKLSTRYFGRVTVYTKVGPVAFFVARKPPTHAHISLVLDLFEVNLSRVRCTHLFRPGLVIDGPLLIVVRRITTPHVYLASMPVSLRRIQTNAMPRFNLAIPFVV